MHSTLQLLQVFNPQERLLQHRKDALSPEIQNYVEEIEQRRKDQGRTEDDYPIAYKFALIASYLGFDDLDETVDDFDNVTRDRNAIAHGYDFDEARLPTEKVWILLGRFVRHYMVREDPGTVNHGGQNVAMPFISGIPGFCVYTGLQHLKNVSIS
jgi:hypothetical protein